MVNSEPNLGSELEKKIDLAIQAIQASQVSNMKDAAQLYDVLYTTLFHRLKGRTTCHNAQINNRKLTTTEEKALL